MLGLMNSSNTKLRSGPKIFMDRLTIEIEKSNLLNQRNFDVWLNLSFRKIPKFVPKKIPIIMRFDGVWLVPILPEKFKFLSSKVNSISIKYANRQLVNNYEIATAVIYQSNFSSRMVKKYISNKYKENIVIYNGIDITKFTPALDKINRKKIKIIVSHKLWPNKRFDQIPLVIKELIKMGADVHVNVIGDGINNPMYFFENSLNYFKKLVSESNLERYFTFFGHIDSEKLPEFYKENDLMLNLSFADPCPNVVIEAMACGLPVIAPNHGGIPELVKIPELLINENLDDLNLYSFFDYTNFPLINAREYAEKILLIKSQLNPMKNAVREISIKNFEIKLIAKKYINFMESFSQRK